MTLLRDRSASKLRRELDAALRVSRALNRQVDVEILVEKALRTALDVVGADAGSVLLADPETKQLVFRHVIGEKAGLLRGQAIPWDQGIAGAVYTSGRPLVSRDVTRDPRHLTWVDASTGYKTRDLIALPLKQWEGKPIGVLEVLNKRHGRLGKDDLAILTIISALTASAIEQARLYEERKLAELGRLLGEVGHDISNMLTPVVCGIGILRGNIQSFFDTLAAPMKAHPTRVLCDQVLDLLWNHMWRIQGRVRELADCVKGLSTPLRLTVCHVSRVAENVMKTLQIVAQQRGVVLVTQGLDALPPIRADERRLYIALYNLVNNAIPEVPAGGSVMISGRADRRNRKIFISISDTGRGMPPEVLSSLFTAHAISRKTGGTGLGTKIVKDVVDAHGGSISVESKEGAGTTFLITLPFKPPQASR